MTAPFASPASDRTRLSLAQAKARISAYRAMSERENQDYRASWRHLTADDLRAGLAAFEALTPPSPTITLGMLTRLALALGFKLWPPVPETADRPPSQIIAAALQLPAEPVGRWDQLMAEAKRIQADSILTDWLQGTR